MLAITEKTLRTTVTLTAGRGRGKSAALGLAIGLYDNGLSWVMCLHIVSYHGIFISFFISFSAALM